jgi:hypothetical protein
VLSAIAVIHKTILSAGHKNRKGADYDRKEDGEFGSIRISTGEVVPMKETDVGTSVPQLLDSVTDIIKRYEARWQKTGEKYNLFKVAGIAHKEVIMCRVLADLLDPKGAHGRGSLYLRLFWGTIAPKLRGCPALDVEHAKVTPEYVIDENRRIDIVLEDGSVFVPFEVKIWAGDQQNQLADYFAFAKTKNRNSHVPALYLTLDGHEPSDFSKAGIGKDDYVPLSFRDDILAWLEACARENENTPETTIPVRENLKQLIAAIKSLCGKSEDEEMNKEIADLIIQSEDTLRAAVAIRGTLQAFDNESKELFKGSIFERVKKELPDAWVYLDEGWHGIAVPLLGGQYALFFDYNWKRIEIGRDDKEYPDTEKKLAAKMSEITRYDNEGAQSIIWATSKSRYPGMEDTDESSYIYELYWRYAKNPDSAARQIVSITRALESVKA